MRSKKEVGKMKWEGGRVGKEEEERETEKRRDGQGGNTYR